MYNFKKRNFAIKSNSRYMELINQAPIRNGVKGKIEIVEGNYKIETKSFLQSSLNFDSDVEHILSPNVDWMETDKEKEEFARKYIGKRFLYLMFYIHREMYIWFEGEKLKVKVPYKEDRIIYVFSNPEKRHPSAKEPVLITYNDFVGLVDISKWNKDIEQRFKMNKKGLALFHHDHGCIVGAEEFVVL